MSKSRFEPKPTPEYLAAVKALKALPIEDRGAAYADATHEDFRKALLDGLTPSNGQCHPLRLLGQLPTLLEHGAWLDHVALWNRAGRPALFTSQPYSLSWPALRDLVAYCQRHGLTADVSARSWHFPGSTLLISVKAGRERNQDARD